MKSTECHISVEVPIPLERAWALLSNFAGWPEWNPFVTRVHGARAPSVGARVQLDVRWADGSGIKSSNEIVEVIDGGTRRGFRWAYRGPLQQLGLLDTNRLIAVEYVSPDSCRYLSDERFTGPLTPLLPIDRIRDGFDRMAAGFASACGAEAAGRASESTARETPRTGVEIEALPEPPMASGALPLLGHLREFQTDHRGLFERGYREHGPVFGVALGPWKCAVIVGPEANATFYGRTDHELRTEHVYGYLRKMFGRVGLTHTPEGYDAERHILLAPFRANLMDDKLRVVDEEVQAFIAGLGERGEFELVGTLQGLLQRIS
ncbi:MAG TPA: SRPBCC family protein, partial [Enhygromyxa sp.]|nr:SRPBCC family protein [Enhygromyxa sp.]